MQNVFYEMSMSEVLKLILEGERLTTSQIGEVLKMNRDEVEAEYAKLKERNILLGWRPVIHPDYNASNQVRAAIELKIRPERDGGFDRLAQRISKFDQVESCYLMSGAYDLLVFVLAPNLQQVAAFVFERLATLEGVESTGTHFMLRAYKEQGFTLLKDKEEETKPAVSP